MPELPELQALTEGLTAALAGRSVRGAWAHPAALRTADPPLAALEGRALLGARRRGKLVLIDAEGGLVLALHLMQAGRLGLGTTREGTPGRRVALELRLDDGRSLRLRELSTTRRASVHLLTKAGLAEHRPMARLGPEPLGLTGDRWREALAAPPARLHTALRDGRRVAGVGRCYASEIMWAARLAPFAMTDRLDEQAWERLASAAATVLEGATERARERISTDMPDRERRVTAVHGHHGEPCLRCGTALDRVSFTEYELVYCAECQTGGRRYADRRRSRFLR